MQPNFFELDKSKYLEAIDLETNNKLIHCCRLQAVYRPITVKNFVTVYTGFDPCN